MTRSFVDGAPVATGRETQPGPTTDQTIPVAATIQISIQEWWRYRLAAQADRPGTPAPVPPPPAADGDDTSPAPA